MMSKTPIKNFSKLEMAGHPNFKKRFMDRIKKYYQSKSKEINEIKEKGYSLEEINFEKYMNIEKDEKSEFLNNLKENVDKSEIKQSDLVEDTHEPQIEKKEEEKSIN